MFLKLLEIIFVGYLLGSVPFAYLAVRIFKKEDIRNVGSGNVGATNTLRVLGLIPGILVLFLDGFKGYLAVALAALIAAGLKIDYYYWALILGGFSAISGHVFPCWLGFKGGKGVATGTGVLLALSPEVFVISVGVSVLIIAVTRYVSLGSLAGSVLVFALMVIFKKPFPYQIMVFLAVVFIFLKHWENIRRLLKGKEKKIGQKPG